MVIFILILVTANCGASVAENCTYFESAGGESGLCTFEILIRNYYSMPFK